MLEAKTDKVAMRAYLQMKIPKLTGIIQPLTERAAKPVRAVQILDG